MFNRKPPSTKISGEIHISSDSSNLASERSIQLDGIKVRLYSRQKLHATTAKETGDIITFFKEKLVSITRTNKNGEFVFYAPKGTYFLKLDIDTLPSGYGAVSDNISSDKGIDGNCRFELRKGHALKLVNSLQIGEKYNNKFFLNAVLTDINGVPLASRISFTFDNNVLPSQGGWFRVKLNNSGRQVIKAALTSGDVTRDIVLNISPPELCSTDRIKLAYDNGDINEKTKIRLYIQALFNRGGLDRSYSSAIPIKSATTIVNEIQDYIRRHDADPSIIREARQYISRNIPTELDKEYISPGKQFKIHYAVTGQHAVPSADFNRNGIPDYIESIGAAFDNVKSVTCTSRGFKEPYLDEGDTQYNVYVYDLQGKYGVTFSSAYYKLKASGFRVASSYICIDNSYAESKGFKRDRDACMKVTAAHEYFHAVQYACNIDADTWWKEASATWNEDEIYPDVNDYVQYVGKVFSSPGKPLEQNSYGGVVFAKFLSENYGGYSIIKKIWEVQSRKSSNSIDAIDKAINESYAAENIGTIFNKYTAYNYNPAQYYREGYLWIQPIQIKSTYTSYPVQQTQASLDHLAADYILFTAAQGKQDMLKIAVSGQDDRAIGFKVQKKRIDSELCDISDITFTNGANRAVIECKGFGGTYSEICLIPANLETRKDGVSYTYTTNI